VDQALRHATEVAKAEGGAVSMGFYTSLSSGPLRDAVAAYRAAVPKVVIDLFEGSPPDLLTALQQRRIDVAFTVGDACQRLTGLTRPSEQPLSCPRVMPG
jgi:DNA-binding transcriptional LysR family regulator